MYVQSRLDTEETVTTTPHAEGQNKTKSRSNGVRGNILANLLPRRAPTGIFRLLNKRAKLGGAPSRTKTGERAGVRPPRCAFPGDADEDIVYVFADDADVDAGGMPSDQHPRMGSRLAHAKMRLAL